MRSKRSNIVIVEDLKAQVPAIHEFFALRMDEVESVSSRAADCLRSAAILLGMPHDWWAKSAESAMPVAGPDRSDLAAYFTYCLPEVLAIDLNAALLTKVAIAILNGHEPEKIDEMVDNLLHNEMRLV